MIVSCADSLIAFETLTTQYVYLLESCDIPEGSYETTVMVKGKDVYFDFGEELGPDVFKFNYLISERQENPARLFARQSAVHVDVVPELDLAAAAEPRGCTLPLDDRRVIEEHRLDRALFDPIDVEKTIWSHRIPLGWFGWVDADAIAAAHASGTLLGGYGPGVLRDICLFRKLPDGRMAGSARFTLPANLEASAQVGGSLMLKLDYVGILRVADAGGELDVIGVGRARNDLDATVEVIYDHKKNTWMLQVDALIEGHVALLFQLLAHVYVRLFKRSMWSERWQRKLLDIGFGWHGGIRITPELGVDFDLGGIVRMGAKEGVSAPPAGAKASGASATTRAAIEQVLTALLDERNATERRREGRSPADALPFQWRKELQFYPKTLDLPFAITPDHVGRDSGPTPVTYPYYDRAVTEYIGVPHNRWPHVGTRFQLLRMAESRNESNRFRDLVARLGFDASPYQIDHVLEEQFGGVDKFRNLWPMERAENFTAGSRHNRDLNTYRSEFANINGRWFEIVLVQYDDL